MKTKRKKILTIAVFSVTLILGITAMVLAWRLQQEEKISEEEASAGDCFGSCNGNCNAPGKCGATNCEGEGNTTYNFCAQTDGPGSTPLGLCSGDAENPISGHVYYDSNGYLDSYSTNSVANAINNYLRPQHGDAFLSEMGHDIGECIALQMDKDGVGASIVYIGDNGEQCYNVMDSDSDGLYWECNLPARIAIRDALGLSADYCKIENQGKDFFCHVCSVNPENDVSKNPYLPYLTTSPKDYMDWDCTDNPTTELASIAGQIYCVDEVSTETYTKVPLTNIDVYSKIDDGTAEVLATSNSNGNYEFSEYTNSDGDAEELKSLSTAQIWITADQIGESVSYGGKIYDTSNLGSISAVDCINVNASELKNEDPNTFNTYYSNLLGLPLFYAYGKIGNYNVGACEWYNQSSGIPSYKLENLQAGATTGIDFTFEEPCPVSEEETSFICKEKTSSPTSESTVALGDRIKYTINYEIEGLTATLIDLLPVGFDLDEKTLSSNCSSMSIFKTETFEEQVQVQCTVDSSSSSVSFAGYVKRDFEGSTLMNEAWIEYQGEESVCNSTLHTIETPEESIDCVNKKFFSSEDELVRIAEVNDILTVQINYNTQNITENVTVTDTLPSQLVPLTDNSAWPNECTTNRTSTFYIVTCTVEPAIQGTVEFPVRVQSAGEIENIAKVEYEDLSETEGCSATLTIAEEEEPTVSCESKSADMIEGEVGDTVTYTISYTSTNVPEGETITVVDSIPTGIDNISVTQPTSGCSYSSSTRELTCEMTQAEGTIIYTATITAAGTLTNTATVSYDDSEDTCSTEITTTDVLIPSASCTEKYAADNTDTKVYYPGETVHYTIQYTVENGPITVYIKDTLPDYMTFDTTSDHCEPIDYCRVTDNTIECTISNAKDNGSVQFCAKVDTTGIPVDGVTITNDEVKVWVKGENEPSEYDTCSETIEVEHEAPLCIVTNPDPITIRLADASNTVEMTTTGYIGTYSDLEFKWVMTYEGTTTTISDWHDSSGTPNSSGYVTDTIEMTPPSGLSEDDTFEIRAYVRPDGSTDNTGVTSNDPENDYDCDADVTITALDLICNWMIPNNDYEYFPFDMTFAADISGDSGAAFTYDLDFGDGSTHYTGSGTVASGTTVELPYVPPQATPHTYNSTTETDYAPRLVVTNTETGETSICPTVLGGKTQSEWSIVKDSNVDTCIEEDSTVIYTIVVTNTGDYTADLTSVIDTLDSKILSSTVTNIKECDANGDNCTTYSTADVLNGQVITWPGRTYTAGESRKYMYTVTINSAGSYYNIAKAIPETGEPVLDDELFLTCAEGTTPTTAPETGIATTAAYFVIIGMIVIAGGYYAYRTDAGAQVVANVMGKTQRSIRRTVNKKETFERDAIRSEKDKLKS